MIHLDTSLLVDALTGPKRSAARLRAAIDKGELLLLSTLVLYEWLRGPRLPGEIYAQEELFPRPSAVPFEAEEAAVAAEFYRQLPRPRSREMDLAVAACAITHDAALWTLNRDDFRDIPDLRLYEPA